MRIRVQVGTRSVPNRLRTVMPRSSLWRRGWWQCEQASIEGLLCCHFIALLVQALIEREIRPLQGEVLDLLGISPAAYASA
jgi:hypothetical protein